jgi:hypothetical protein
LHPEGILKSDYIEKIGGYSKNTGAIEGDKLLKDYTKEIE